MYVTVSLKLELDASSSLDELESGILTAGRVAMKEALKEAIGKIEQEQKRCPHCGNEQSRSAGTVRRVLQTIFGRVEVNLRRQRCTKCGKRFRPAQGCLSSLKGQTITAQLQELAALVGCSWPYEAAAGVLKELCGAVISDERLRQITNQRGKAQADKQLQEAEQVVNPTMQDIRKQRDQERRAKSQKPPKVQWLQVGLDGGWVPSRDQAGGMEGKIAVVASEVEKVGKQGRHRLSRRRYVATFSSSQDLGTLAYAAAHELGATIASQQVVLGDGADWIKTQANLHFPDAKKVLDWAHLWRVIQKAIRAVRPGQCAARRAWRKQQYEILRPLLWQGQVDEALAHLQALRPTAGQEPLKRLEDAISYLQTQRDWIGSYEQLRTHGYPVGSGLVERAVAVVINARMKKRGMRWKRTNATSLVALRVQYLNAQWDAAA